MRKELSGGNNFVPTNGWSTCNARFRAVDNAGNMSGWSDSVHIHQDTEKPTLTNWWYGTTNKNIIQIYVQTTDNIGISKVQLPTSTEKGGGNNWIWVDAVWDASANAYRADIYPSSWGHYGTNYYTHLYIYDHAGNGGLYSGHTAYIQGETYTITMNRYQNNSYIDSVVMNDYSIKGFYHYYDWHNTTGVDITIKYDISTTKWWWDDDGDYYATYLCIVPDRNGVFNNAVSNSVGGTGELFCTTVSGTLVVPNGYHLAIFNCNNASSRYTLTAVDAP